MRPAGKQFGYNQENQSHRDNHLKQPHVQVLKLPEHYYVFMVDGGKHLASNHTSLCHLIKPRKQKTFYQDLGSFTENKEQKERIQKKKKKEYKNKQIKEKKSSKPNYSVTGLKCLSKKRLGGQLCQQECQMRSELSEQIFVDWILSCGMSQTDFLEISEVVAILQYFMG